ncbi:MAG: TIGR00366 family protein [Gammaproteobacteria bacterium]|nr:TIGR00366 family protein [Gammaproteobacteria bacterium]
MARLSLEGLARPFVRVVERWYPDAYVFAILLTLLTFVLAIGLTDAGPGEALDTWGEGLSGLLAFTTQIALTLILAHSLAHTDAARALLARVAELPRTPFAAYFTVAVSASLASLLAWSLGLAAGALIAAAVARAGHRRGLELDYPLLVASAYSGFVVWHMGYSGSSPLFVATPGHILEDRVGIIPVTETVFASWNLAIAAVTVPTVALVCALMRPSRVTPMPQHLLDADDAEEAERLPASPGGSWSSGGRCRCSRGCCSSAWLVRHFFAEGPALDLNVVNWTFLAGGLLLARSPVHYVRLVTRAGSTLGPILLQYPFYAGIMGLMAGTGLVQVISDFFVGFSGADTLPFWAFVSGGIVNFFVPSGGGQWVVQGPVFVEAALELGVPIPEVVMAVSYGDQWSNLIQPFWTIPLLAIAGLPLRSVLGYCFVTFAASGVIFGVGLLRVAAAS